jgi:hypothetical protein
MRSKTARVGPLETPRIQRETFGYIGTIYEGTSNMQLQTIARGMLK